MDLLIYLSTGMGAEEKARTVVEVAGGDLFEYVFSESKLPFSRLSMSTT